MRLLLSSPSLHPTAFNCISSPQLPTPPLAYTNADVMPSTAPQSSLLAPASFLKLNSEADSRRTMTPSAPTVEQQQGGEGKPTGDAAAAEWDETSAAAGKERAAETLLRVVPMGLCLSALVIMLNNKEDNDFGDVSYADLGAFRYLVYANGACAAYSLLSAFYIAMRRPVTLSSSWTVFLLDQLLTYVILAAGTVSAEIMYLAYNGDEKVTWSKQCGVFDGFCRRATTSIGITFGSVACYVLLSLFSSYRLFSTYEVPLSFLDSKGLEKAACPL